MLDRESMLEEVEQPGIATYPMLCSPLELLGEHPDEVLAEVLTLSDAEIGRLQDEGVATAPTPVAV